MQPRGYRIKFQIVDCPGGMPGDIGISVGAENSTAIACDVFLGGGMAAPKVSRVSVDLMRRLSRNLTGLPLLRRIKTISDQFDPAVFIES